MRGIEEARSNVSQWTSQLAIRWTSAMSAATVRGVKKGPRFYQVDDMRFELGMTLNLYAALLRERALEVVRSGTSSFIEKAWTSLEAVLTGF